MVSSTSTIGGGSTAADKHRVGRWTCDEKLLFLHGLQKFGKGRWKKISVYLPNRSLVQIKSHAQKVIKRLDEGEDIFSRLNENQHYLERLTADLQQTTTFNYEPRKKKRRLNNVLPTNVKSTKTAAAVTQSNNNANAGKTIVQKPTKVANTTAASTTSAAVVVVTIPAKKTPKTVAKATTRQKVTDVQSKIKGGEHILAASALCQLAAPRTHSKQLLNCITPNTSSTNMAAQTGGKATTELRTCASSPLSTLWDGSTFVVVQNPNVSC